MKLFADKCHAALKNTDRTGQRRKEQQDKEHQSEQLAARKSGEHLRQRHEGKAAAHSQSFRPQRDKHNRDDRKGRQNGHHGIQCADADRTLHQMIVPRNVGTVRHHDPHAYGKGKEGLSQCPYQRVAVKRLRPNSQHKGKSLFRPRKRDCPDHAGQKEKKQRRHQDLADTLNS